MIVLLSLFTGMGLLMIWESIHVEAGLQIGTPKAITRAIQRFDDTLIQAGVARWRKRGFILLVFICVFLAFVTVFLISKSMLIALIFGAIGASVPIAWLQYQARSRRVQLRDVLPDVVDMVYSGVRAGLSLPEALVQLGARGPEAVRAEFAEFAQDYRLSGSMEHGLNRLKEALADPGADRLIESIRLARQVGGTQLGQLLTTLSAFLRDDARVRAEIEAKQSGSVQAAKLALAAPWVVLLLMSFRPEAVQAYDSPQGFMVLLFGGVLSVVAYRIMLRISRLPTDVRVLR